MEKMRIHLAKANNIKKLGTGFLASLLICLSAFCTSIYVMENAALERVLPCITIIMSLIILRKITENGIKI